MKDEDEDKNIDNQEQGVEQEQAQSSAETEKSESEHMIPKSRLDEEIQKRKDLEKRLAAVEKASSDAEKKRLQEQKDYQALYEKSEAELTEYKPKAERAEALEAVLSETLQAEFANIPEDRRSLIPDELSVEAKLRYISKNRAMLSKVQPFDVGAGRRGGGAQKSIELSPEELQIAKDYGMTPEEYAKYKDQN